MATSSSQLFNNLANLLPTGTFMAFQTLAPIFTNNSVCGAIERTMSGILVVIFSLICFSLSFTDSLTTKDGQIYYGIVTTKGLYNSQFKRLLNIDSNFYVGNTGSSQFYLRFSDFLNAFLTVVSFCTLALLTPPLTHCFYPYIPSTITKTVPIIVALLVGMVFGLSPPARHGVGFALGNIGPDNILDTSNDQSSASAPNLAPNLNKSASRVSLLKKDTNGNEGTTAV
ncbi:hypothetical protein O6H91_20G074500 [Diphasiastrum complanatum]|uniref:Uncharacterized protein n=1 Tax=Diphasiastrum complanatum TaxID=34168 RepID=A0ACC2ARR9_DIPCM|nr:hypothetical protein O6H91_20G074500 [Diphasiastrum complanatum]